MRRSNLLLAAALCLASAAHAQSNKCLTLDGDLDGVRVSSTPASLNLGSRHTFMAWVRLQELSSLGGVLEALVVKHSTDPNVLAYAYSFVPQSMNFAADFGDGARLYSAALALKTGDWHHVAFTHDGGSNGTWYVDGEVSSLSTNVSIHRAGTNDLLMGRWNVIGGQNQDFHGEIDEVSLWTNRLSVGDINYYMRRKLVGTEPALVAYWNFDSGAPTNLMGGGNGAYIDNATALAEASVTQAIGHAVQVSLNSGFPTTTHRLQWTTNLVGGTWKDVGSPVYGNGQTQSVYDGTSDETQTYYRIVTQ